MVVVTVKNHYKKYCVTTITKLYLIVIIVFGILIISSFLISFWTKYLLPSSGKNKNDPVWHNHFVKLDKHVSGLCGNNPEVVDITFQSPGSVDIQGSKAILSDIPKKFSGTDALTHDKLTLAPGNDVQNVVSFKLDPKFQDGNLKAVCVENITPAEHITNE